MELASRPRIGIIGAGALGGFYGARLARAGHDVHFLMRSDFQAVSENGLFVKSYEGDFHIFPEVYPTAAEMGICDLIIVGLKTIHNDALPELLGLTVGSHTTVLTLQNGLGNEEAVSAALGNDESAQSRIMGGIAFLCSNRVAPGQIHHIDHGWIRVAEFVGPATEHTHKLADLFLQADIKVEVYDSLLRARWEKLVWNIPFNGLGVAAHAHTAAVLANEELARAARGLMEETILAARSDAVSIDPDHVERMMTYTATMGDYRTSMQLDWEAGKPLELEAILGEPMRRARAAGLRTPRLEMLYAIAKELNPY